MSNVEEIKKVIENLKEKNITAEGVYTHMYNANCEAIYRKQLSKFEEILNNVEGLKNTKIIHCSASEALSNYEKPSYVNGCRLGIIMYGFTKNKDLKLESTLGLYSEVIQINELFKGETVRI